MAIFTNININLIRDGLTFLKQLPKRVVFKSASLFLILTNLKQLRCKGVTI